MTDIAKTKENPLGQFWDELDAATAVMLGSPDHADHMQPMAANGSPEEGLIWFFTRDDTDIAKKANGGTAHMCLVGKNQDYHACVAGSLDTIRSQPHIDRFWNTVAAAWFPDGKHDPHLTLLRFRPSDAAIWASTGSAISFGWQIAKANLTGSEPDVGYKTEVRFPGA
ncbi:MAG: pyridoxamine 5'-phosphate oxidase family protein [Beijerinckiaceae bacterium]